MDRAAPIIFFHEKVTRIAECNSVSRGAASAACTSTKIELQVTGSVTVDRVASRQRIGKGDVCLNVIVSPGSNVSVAVGGENAAFNVKVFTGRISREESKASQRESIVAIQTRLSEPLIVSDGHRVVAVATSRQIKKRCND